MTKRVPTGVSILRAVLALTIVWLVPSAASASSLTPVPVQTTVAADGTIQFQGEFTWDNDVALIPFFLGDGEFLFDANTTSYAAGGFDPMLSLFYMPDNPEPAIPQDLTDLVLHYYPGPDGGVLVPAWFDDIDLELSNNLLDSSTSVLTPAGDRQVLTLEGGRQYYLALTQTGNYPTDLFGFTADADEFQCSDGVCEQLFGGYGAFFGGTVQITPVVDTTPVPEPGTLSLLALGSLATAIVRRRRRAAVTTRS
jgi:hypothetical protein